MTLGIKKEPIGLMQQQNALLKTKPAFDPKVSNTRANMGV
jgi:hypothetical protein